VVAGRSGDLPQVRPGRPELAAARLEADVGLRVNEVRMLDLDNVRWAWTGSAS
jgi:hypothetical protein